MTDRSTDPINADQWGEPTVLIDCDSCIARGPGCPDCVISLFRDSPVRARDLSADERVALASLAGAGLVPPLRLVPRADGPSERAS